MLNLFVGITIGIVCTLAAVKFLSFYANRIRQAERAKTDRRNELAKLRYAANQQVPLRSKARSIVRSAILLEKKFRYELGYEIRHLIEELESGFDSSMSFDNYGEVWEIDHVKPLTAFDLTDILQFKQAIHPSNLQPLFRGENQSKGAK